MSTADAVSRLAAIHEWSAFYLPAAKRADVSWLLGEVERMTKEQDTIVLHYETATPTLTKPTTVAAMAMTVAKYDEFGKVVILPRDEFRRLVARQASLENSAAVASPEEREEEGRT